MSEQTFYSTVINEFGLNPTDSQQELFRKLESFVRKSDGQQLFVISGYAGTGKTSVLGAYVRALNFYKVKTKLLAPTGRAAKVFSHKAKQEAHTIHKHIRISRLINFWHSLPLLLSKYNSLSLMLHPQKK